MSKPPFATAISAIVVAVTSVTVGTGHASQAPPPPRLVIDSPKPDDLFTSTQTIRAHLEPAAIQASRVEFFVDGRPACRPQRPPYECDNLSGDAPIAHTIVAVATVPGLGDLQTQVTTKGLRIGVFETATVRRTAVTFAVLDSRGRRMRGIEQEQIRVLEDDVPQEIDAFEAHEPALDIVLAVDLSSSMEKRIGTVRVALQLFLSLLKDYDHVTIVGFNDRTYVFDEGVADRRTLISRISSVAPVGGTALRDAIVKSTRLLTHGSNKQAVILFTDGVDDRSLTSAASMETRLKGTSGVLVALTQTSGSQAKNVEKYFDRITNLTGGYRISIGDVKELGERLNEILEELRAYYFVSYTPARKPDQAFHRIRVEIPGLKNITIRARQGAYDDIR